MNSLTCASMEAVRLTLLVIFAAAFLEADAMVRVSGNGDYILCDPKPDDVVLYQGSVEKAHSWLRKVETELKLSTGDAVIHCIQVIDKTGDGNAADVSVADGGVGSSRVTLKFSSQRSSGIHFNVTISGK